MEKIANELIEMSKCLCNSYELLYNYELKYGKNTDTYKELVSEIKQRITQEKEVLKKVNDLGLTAELLNYIAQKYNINKVMRFQLDENKQAPIDRVMNKLYVMRVKNNSAPNELSDSEISLNLFLEKLILTLTISESVKTTRDISYLTKIKYDIAKTMPLAEDILLLNNFEEIKHPYMTHQTSYYYQPEAYVKILINNNLLKELLIYLKELIAKSNSYQNDDINYSKYIFLSSSLRACLTLMTEHEQQVVIEIIQRTIQAFMNKEKSLSVAIPLTSVLILDNDLITKLSEETYGALSMSQNPSMSIEILKNTLEQLESDRRIPNYIRIGR